MPSSFVGKDFYVITRGALVGVLLHWWVVSVYGAPCTWLIFRLLHRTRTAPYVLGVKGAVFVKVDTLEEGARLMLDAIDDGLAKYLNTPVLP
ncbi:hypothetical protein JVU11DRAFT_11067 [Chiua virens]|nr:hypothetical protein JVU11DRAFT_11067 [Chiua virens]